MPRPAPTFALRFPIADIPDLAARYQYADESAAMTSGRAIAAGEHTRANLTTIHRWKTKGRGRSRLGWNTDVEIADALALAVAAKTDRAAASVLCGLAGVKLPVASAVLMAIDPARYTIIDVRALDSLGALGNRIDLRLYLTYLHFCRALAFEAGTSLRTLDRALWQWSKRYGSAVVRDDDS
ncbi:hypothetical protein MKK75_10980 [Methylobacterium sp. J-030]|uniref:hypothetical protein n=1 Tax=Methylobacterium sp. J-030 TaxID=2836627 RepID=UPI001FBB1C7F|nr:hypothetical protein [Methylobacterium sp. J-030]MCJ2069317.1 hypothetical protein [Methylobacterium sp. J-030]